MGDYGFHEAVDCLVGHVSVVDACPLYVRLPNGEFVVWGGVFRRWCTTSCTGSTDGHPSTSAGSPSLVAFIVLSSRTPAVSTMWGDRVG